MASGPLLRSKNGSSLRMKQRADTAGSTFFALITQQVVPAQEARHHRKTRAVCCFLLNHFQALGKELGEARCGASCCNTTTSEAKEGFTLNSRPLNYKMMQRKIYPNKETNKTTTTKQIKTKNTWEKTRQISGNQPQCWHQHHLSWVFAHATFYLVSDTQFSLALNGLYIFFFNNKFAED